MTSQPIVEAYLPDQENESFDIALVEKVGATAVEHEAEIYLLHHNDKDDDYVLLTDEELDDWLKEAPSLDILRMYLSEIGRTPLLTAEQEVELSVRVQRGLRATERLELIGSEGIRVNKANVRKLEAEKTDGIAARNHFAEANLRLVVSLAKRYQGKGVDLQDLIQDANENGLFHAINKFDPNKGYKFSTYATWWIRQSLQRSVMNNGRTIRIPVPVLEKINRINRIKRTFLTDNGREPTLEELSAEVGMTKDKLEETLGYDKEKLSLDFKLGTSHNSAEAVEYIEDAVVAPPDEIAIKGIALKALKDVLTVEGMLTEREKLVLIERYGLGEDGAEKTERQVARKLKLPYTVVAFAEASALDKIRNSDEAKKLAEYL